LRNRKVLSLEWKNDGYIRYYTDDYNMNDRYTQEDYYTKSPTTTKPTTTPMMTTTLTNDYYTHNIRM